MEHVLLVSLEPGAPSPASLGASLDSAQPLPGSGLGGIALARLRLDPERHEEEVSTLLDGEESAGLESLRSPPARRTRRLARALGRLTAARALGLAPQAVRFAAGRHGKPRLVGARGSLSLSWRTGRIAIAWSATRELGVDLETPVTGALVDAVAPWFFHPGECTALEHAGHAREGLFLRFWTRKEALSKAAGRGLDAVSRLDTRAEAVPLRDEYGHQQRFGLFSLDQPLEGVVLSLAVGGRLAAPADGVCPSPRHPRRESSPLETCQGV